MVEEIVCPSLCQWRLRCHFLIHGNVLELHGRKGFHPVDAHGSRGVQRNEKRKKTKNVFTLLLWCHPGVWMLRQSNLTQNSGVNAIFFAKLSTVAS